MPTIYKHVKTGDLWQILDEKDTSAVIRRTGDKPITVEVTKELINSTFQHVRDPSRHKSSYPDLPALGSVWCSATVQGFQPVQVVGYNINPSYPNEDVKTCTFISISRLKEIPHSQGAFEKVSVPKKYTRHEFYENFYVAEPIGVETALYSEIDRIWPPKLGGKT